MNEANSTPKGKKAFIIYAGALLLIGVIYCIGYLDLPSRWWFEDDPILYSYAARISNPAKIFVDPNILGHFTAGKALVPMQILTFWIDGRLAGFSPKFAYLHHIFSFLLLLLLLYWILAREYQNSLAAFSVSLLWALLPATASVLQFISTRHYMEGMLFSALAFVLLQRIREFRFRIRFFSWIAIFACLITALLSKETHLPVVFGILLFFSLRYRDKRLAIAACLLTIVYFAYRYSMIGIASSYDMPFLNPEQSIRYFFKLPYTFFCNYGGYYWGTIVFALIMYFGRGKLHFDNKFLALFIAILILSFGVIFTASYGLYFSIRTPGPWYRIMFSIHSLALLGCGYMVVRFIPSRIQAIIFLAALILSSYGIHKSKALWTGMAISAEREGKFYAANPDKILLSEQQAAFFIPGVHAMYSPTAPPHFVHINDLAKTKLAPGAVLWRFRNGEFVPDSIKK